MSNTNADLIMPTELTVQDLFELYKSAYMECEIDEDGDLVLYEDSVIFVSVDERLKNHRIQLRRYFTLDGGVSLEKALEFTNEINDDYIVARAKIVGEKKDLLLIDYWILLDGGIPPATIIHTTKRFMSIARGIGDDATAKDLIMKDEDS